MIALVRYNNLVAKRKMAAVSIQKMYRGCSERLMVRRLISNAITTQLILISRESASIKASKRDSARKIRETYVSSTKKPACQARDGRRRDPKVIQGIL